MVLLFTVFVLLAHCTSVKSFHNVGEHGGLPGLLVLKTIENLSKPCGPDTCQNNGRCQAVTDGFFCLCKYPFFGEFCEKHPCTTNPCDNNGICRYDLDGFTCVCKSPFLGRTCSLDICDLDPCNNGGTCELDGDSYRCKCPFPYSGKRCENDFLNLCAYNPCQNGGICSQDGDTFKCTCTGAWTGTTCERDPCSPNPCENGGKCKLIDYSFSCTCKNPHFGETCELGPCAPNPCKNGGECEEDGESFKCTCESPFTGSTCEQKFCETDSDCLHGGTCRKISTDKNSCVCAPNYGGSRCEVKLLCVSLDQSCRMMNAVCVVVDNHAICACPNGTVYQRKSGLCEDICDPRECLHGKCEIIGKTHKCNCDEGYTGSRCDKKERELQVSENITVWFTMTAFINLFMCLLLIGMFCFVCRIKRKMQSTEVLTWKL